MFKYCRCFGLLRAAGPRHTVVASRVNFKVRLTVRSWSRWTFLPLCYCVVVTNQEKTNLTVVYVTFRLRRFAKAAILFNVIQSVRWAVLLIKVMFILLKFSVYFWLLVLRHWLFFNWCSFWHKQIKNKDDALLANAVSLEADEKLAPKAKQRKPCPVAFKGDSSGRVEPVFLPSPRPAPSWMLQGIRMRQPRWESRSSADQTRFPAGPHPWPGTDTRPGCVCTARQEHRCDFFMDRWTEII